jgi:hypothetical protein
MVDSLRLEAGTATGDVPAPMLPLNPTSLGQLSGDDLVKSGTSNRPGAAINERLHLIC